MDVREQIRQRFNRYFGRWEIELPLEALVPGKVWFIVQRGWTIWTRFEADTEEGQTHLDYYAMHRMTNDQHVRVHADGEEEYLPAMESGYSHSQDATAKERKEARDKYLAYNHEVETLLQEKGFLMTDQAHGSAILNRYLQTHPGTDDAS